MHSALYMRSIFKRTSNRNNETKQYLPLEKGWWKMPILFLLSMAMLGLKFYPALAFIIAEMVYVWRNGRRYDFLIMCTFVAGCFGFTQQNLLKIWPADIALLVSMALWLCMRRAPILNKALVASLAYIALLFLLAMMSIESMTVQVLMIRPYLLFLYIIVPFAVFSGKEFSFEQFCQRLFCYMLPVCCFYILDAYILSGNVLVPCTYSYFRSTFWDPYCYPLSGFIMRKYPPGLYLTGLLMMPLARMYKLKMWQWVVFILAAVSTQTFTFITALAITFIASQRSRLRILKWILSGLFMLVAAYCIDALLPEKIQDGYTQSTMRIKSSVDQILALNEAVDDEDIAEFGSGRLAQAMPKLDLVAKNDKQLTGLGFLHPEKTHINQYVIVNEYYSDVSNNIEVATGVEIGPIQVYINIGWIGLIGHFAFFIVLGLFLRRLPLRSFYWSVMLFNVWLSLGGFAGLSSVEGLIMQSLAWALPVLAARGELAGPSAPWKEPAHRTAATKR